MIKYDKKTLTLILVIKAMLLFGVIFYLSIGLGPDEAQYWTWSRALDWGYYSKPPGIAWQIWLGTALFGQTVEGVRFVSIILAVLQALAVYRLALVSGLQARAAFWCGILMALCPIGMFGSLFAITDGGFLLFWTLASIIMAKGLNHRKEPSAVWIGLCILSGALFKWPIYSFWIFYYLFRYFYFPTQRLFSSLIGVAISLMGLWPSLWWNWRHDWATFRHVGATLQGGHGSSGGNVIEFVGAQASLLSPILFVLLMLAFREGVKSYRRLGTLSPALLFCGFVSFTTLLLALIAALFQKIQGNWCLFAYPTGIVLLGWYSCERKPKVMPWMKAGVGLSLGLVLLVFLWPSSSILYRVNPFKHNMGWGDLKLALTKYGYQADRDFLISDKYQTTSLLSFYNEGQERAYFLNLEGHRNNQFAYWPDLQDEQKGKTGFFVWVENAPHLQKNWEERQQHYQHELEKYFEQVDFLGLVPLIFSDQHLYKGALFFKCRHCNGARPENSLIY